MPVIPDFRIATFSLSEKTWERNPSFTGMPSGLEYTGFSSWVTRPAIARESAESCKGSGAAGRPAIGNSWQG
jgi:hypothetical protein